MTIMEKLEFPQRFGFPCLVVLNEEGRRLHTQNSAFLEKEKSYNKKRLLQFLKNWSPAALDPGNYKKKKKQIGLEPGEDPSEI